MIRKLQSTSAGMLGVAVLHTSRLLESLLPPRLLRWAFVPLSAALALHGILRHPPSPASRRARPYPLAAEHSAAFRARLRLQLSRFLSNWPDRLSAPHWRRRIEIHGAALDVARRSGRPVILVSGHFGPFHMAGYFLRAMGYPVASFIGNSGRSRWASRRAKDRLSHLPNIKHVFSAEDPLREVFGFLKQGNILRMSFDVAAGKSIKIPCADTLLSFATGSVRMAAATGATLIPFAISEVAPWRFAIQLGTPVPPELLSPGEDPAPAARHILTECWRFFSQAPAQAQPILLEAFSMD
jgi:lauroyl/myristoyl acyltransferase